MKYKWLKALRPPERMKISEWSDKYRKLPSTSAEPGQWKTSRVPYMKEVMDAFCDSQIKRITVKAAAQVSKALWIGTPIATVDGFKLMRDIQIGDKVFDEQGEVCNVVGISPIRENRPCYEITFSCGAKIIADAEHNWYVQDSRKSAKRIMRKLTTEQISHDFKVYTGSHPFNRYAVPLAKPLDLPEKNLPIDGYLLGYWLGDGNSERGLLAVHGDDLENIIQRAAPEYDIHITKDNRSNNFLVRLGKSRFDGKKFTTKLRTLNLLKNKHIPPEYLRGSYEQRLNLLKGLMDSDGTIDAQKSRCRFSQKSELLTAQVMELLWTLGFKPTLLKSISKYIYKGEKKSAAFRTIMFTAYDDVPVFYLQRKLERQKSRAGKQTNDWGYRRIVDVKKVESVPVKCISVDSPNHLYLAGRELIPTKNSECLLNIVGYYAHLDPCNIMIMQPTLETAEDFSKSRLSKMIQDTPILTPLFYEKQKTRDSTQTILSKFFKGGRVILVGSNSPAGLASRPIRILLCDEVDRYPLSAGNKEGDPVDLAERRTTTYFNAKVALFSTPTQEGASRIDIEYELGTQEEWRHKCPNCSEFHRLDYRQMQCDYVQSKNAAGQKTIIIKSVKWRCPDCGFEFDELEMKNSEQKYFAQNPDALKNGVRSFWVNGFSSPWLTWERIMREWLEAQGNAVRESVVMNTRFGLSYQLRGEYNDENLFLERRKDYDGEIPSGVLLLTAAVDVQANRLEYEIAGWGVGEQRWGILRGLIRGEPNQIGTWQALDKILDRNYYFSSGTPIKVSRTFIDSGYATANVYDYCRARAAKGRFAIKGVSASGAPLLYRFTYPKGAGLILTLLGVNDGKNEIYSRLNLTEGECVMIYPHDDEFLKRSYDSIYFKQLISERKVLRRVGGLLQYVFEPISSHERNEALDLAVYNLACFKSCIGNAPAEEFWRSRQEMLTAGSEPIKKVPAQKKTIAWREVDLWT